MPYEYQFFFKNYLFANIKNVFYFFKTNKIFLIVF